MSILQTDKVWFPANFIYYNFLSNLQPTASYLLLLELLARYSKSLRTIIAKFILFPFL